ncbi:hypothetical protein [Acinetobacter sp. CFCC 10889]|uniref:hypothetical protein n=1 Tax=Acinetobacter sp. CFCC 10889 TaxID=1775557 RepID=UPI000DCF8A49|nr:hypothetical protein [Acinetobacter sp. CFCC 10889]
MNKEKLNELRSKITIPLAEALALLRQYDENIERCIQAYHDENIGKICFETACESMVAEKYYYDVSYQNNVKKVVEKIIHINDALNEMPIKLTVEENPETVSNIGFFIWAADEDLEFIVSEKNRRYFIPSDDFSYVIEIFRSMYPVLNPCSGKMERYFDACFDNYFGQETIQRIISKIQILNFLDINVMNFLAKIVQCLEEKMSIGTYVVVEGNQ